MAGERLLVSVPGWRLHDALGRLRHDVDVVEWDLSTAAPFDHADIVVPPYLGSPTVLGQLATVSVRLIQSQSIGYDRVVDSLPPGNVFANAVGVHETSTAELAMALILASQRAIPDFVRDAQQGRWAPTWRPSLADSTVLLVGYGGVGKALEARLLPFETTVVRVARTARSDERGPVHGLDDLPELLAAADVVVVAVPLTESTTHLIDDRFLSMVKDGALVVNIARGRVADTQALLAHASTGRIRVALDVADPEPLPSNHPLFGLPNVLVSPHVGGMSTAMLPRMARLLNDQVQRMARGDDPINVVLRS
jgi:phosphoglycerate dehydrogenase-like enzyme